MLDRIPQKPCKLTAWTWRQRLTLTVASCKRICLAFRRFTVKSGRLLGKMLKRAFSTSSTRQQYHQASHSARWKVRLCYGFLLLVFITLAVLLIAWNMLCGLPSTKPLLEGESTKKLILNGSFGSVPLDPLAPKRHTIDIYYEVLCPDSRYFIMKEFNPVYNQLSNYIKPSFIPFGKASTKSRAGRLIFDCQHGEIECQGNMIHSCATVHVTNEQSLVAYIGCMINNNRNPEEIGKKCAKELEIDWDPIQKCWKGTEGPELLKAFGERTLSLLPPVSFIPTIGIDRSQKGQKEILKGLKSFVCQNTLKKEKPKECQDGLDRWRFNAK